VKNTKSFPEEFTILEKEIKNIETLENMEFSFHLGINNFLFIFGNPEHFLILFFQTLGVFPLPFSFCPQNQKKPKELDHDSSAPSKFWSVLYHLKC
jgi:hypothetical protein